MNKEEWILSISGRLVERTAHKGSITMPTFRGCESDEFIDIEKLVDIEEFDFDLLLDVIKKNTKPDKNTIVSLYIQLNQMFFYKNISIDEAFEILKHHMLPEKCDIIPIIRKFVSLHYGIDIKELSVDVGRDNIVFAIFDLMVEAGLKYKNGEDSPSDIDILMNKLNEYHDGLYE